MPKSRGSYKKYLYDPNIPVPDRTRYEYLIQHKKQTANNQSHSLSNNELINLHSTNISLMPQTSQQQLTNSHHPSTIIQQPSASSQPPEVTNEDQYEHADLSFTEFNSDSDSDSDSNISEFLKTELKREDLAAVFLAWFYSGSMTQDSLKGSLEISNMSNNSIKLPTSFDGLTNIIFEKKKKFIHKKVWFCGVCLKTFSKEQVNRFERACRTCKTR